MRSRSWLVFWGYIKNERDRIKPESDLFVVFEFNAYKPTTTICGL